MANMGVAQLVDGWAWGLGKWFQVSGSIILMAKTFKKIPGPGLIDIVKKNKIIKGIAIMNDK